MRQVSGAAAAGDGSAPAAFQNVVDCLRAQRDQLAALRPELIFEDVPAPRTLAPFASATAATVRSGGDEIASGRLVLLYDPAGQPGWAGPLRVIIYVRAELDPEIAADPLVGQVGWTWLTEALDNRAAGYAAPSGTVTREVTEGFGTKAGEPLDCEFELRASWSPTLPAGCPQPGHPARPDDEPAELAAHGQLGGHLAAWCDTICAAAGLPPLAAGVTALSPSGSRRQR